MSPRQHLADHVVDAAAGDRRLEAIGVPDDPARQVAAVRATRHAHPVRIGQAVGHQRIQAGHAVAHRSIAPVGHVGGQEVPAISLRAARVAGVHADPAGDQQLPLPDQRPAVQGPRPSVDLEHDRGRASVSSPCGACRNQPWMRRPSTSCQRSTGATSLTSRHASPIKSLTRRSSTRSPAPRRPARMSPTTTSGASIPLVRTAATRSPPRGEGAAAEAAEVVPPARQPLEASAVDLHSPQLEAALDRGREDQPTAVPHPVQGRLATAEQVAVHGGRCLQVGPGDEVLRLAIAYPEAPDRCLRQLAALPVAVADGGHPPAIRRPCRRPPALSPAPGGELAHPLCRDIDEVDIGAPREIGVAMTVGHECDPLPIRRPARVLVMVIARGEQLGIARRDVDEPQVLEPVVDEAGAIELVGEGIDEPRVRERRVIRPAIGLLLGLGRGRAADDAQASAIRRPCQAGHVARQVRQLARLSAVRERKEPHLGPALLRRLGRSGLRTAAAGLQHGPAIGEEGERPAVRAPVRGGVGLRSDRQLAGRGRAIGGRDPQRGAVAILARRDRLDGERHEPAVGREVELGRDAKVVEVLRARRASSHRATISWRVGGIWSVSVVTDRRSPQAP